MGKSEKSEAELREGAASKKSGIDHVYDLSKWIGSIMSDKDSSDITLVVEGEAVYAHKIILAASCDYFRALFRGGMMESNLEEVELKDVTARGFNAVLKYIYTARWELKSMDVETILEVLSVADLYGLQKMRTSLCEYLEEIMSTDNVLLICDSLEPLSLKHLHEVCAHFMDQVPQAVLESEAFCTSRASTLSRILSRDSFCAEEIDIFRAVTRWCKKNPDPEDQAEVLGRLRLPLIPTRSLLTEVKSSSLITTDRLIEAIQMRECHSADLPLRGVLTQGQNLATKEDGAKMLIIEEDGSEVFALPEAYRRCHSEDIPEYYLTMDLPVQEAFTVALGQAFYVDYISFRMRKGSSASFGYHVEVSVDLVDWIRVFNQSELVCRSLQRLHFKPRMARFIRLHYHELPWHENAHLSEFEASLTGLRDLNFCKGYYAPAGNVATMSLGAAVVECSSGIDEMIGGKSKDGLAGTGWTEHEIGGKPIIVQLSQPYAVNSIKVEIRYSSGQLYQNMWYSIFWQFAAANDLQIAQCDVTTAFLYGDLEEDIFMWQPEGLDAKTGRVCKLQKSLYGLRQAPLQWDKKIASELWKLGLTPCTSDPCVFVRTEDELMFALYVDDGLCVAPDMATIDGFLDDSQKTFKMTRGRADRFVEIEIVRDRGKKSIKIHQKAYMRNVLDKYSMTECKHVSTPCIGQVPPKNIDLNGNELESYKAPYRQLIGSLLYAAIATRADIASVVNQLSYLV
ncbi:BTB/POZ domain-containing protein 9-like [Galendromus occidentalis]|uniref:BTB/POZ domain-containing protein 9-like n=1 Tax=Galendromus occidentalis TaxID=34638 RepID=A0AAJ7SHA0_9ACAR|nr:BTB/POZ domain-containing protein 9-like [Galendromus occidentalis]